MPETVEKFRRSFDAAGWAPETDLPVDEKQHRTRDVGYDNDHERDALAAALFAFDAHEDQLDRITRKVPPQLERGEVVARVLRGEGPVDAVVDAMTESDEPEPEEHEHEERELTPEEKRIKDLESQVARLQEHVENLESDLGEKDDRIETLEDELSEAKREERQEARERREVTRLEWENSRLEDELEERENRVAELESKLGRLKDLWKLDHSNLADIDNSGNLVPVKVVEQFTVDAIEAADDAYGISRGDVVYLRDASGAGRRTAQLLADFEPRVVLRSGGISEIADEVLFENDIPVAPADDVKITEVDELAVAPEAHIANAISEWEDRAAEREQARTETMVDSIISEHRADRE